MSINEEYSVVRYDPRQGLLGHQAAGSIRPSLGRTSTPLPPSETPVSTFIAGRSPRQDKLHLVYSLRRTIETAPVRATGQIVDIFV